jgi:hypothetical protein
VIAKLPWRAVDRLQTIGEGRALPGEVHGFALADNGC